MFEQLLGSKTRYKLLQLFVNHPDAFYYVRQLTRLLETQINSVRRELMHLADIGFIRSDDELSEKEILLNQVSVNSHETNSSQKKYFKLNPECILYPELKAIFMKEQMMSEKDLVKDLKKCGEMSLLIFTGRFVGLEEHIPTDVLIVGKMDQEKINKVFHDYERSYNREINYTILNQQEYMYRKNINDRFLHTILQSKKIIPIDQMEENAQDDVNKENVVTGILHRGL